jgi:hypothetical protein
VLLALAEATLAGDPEDIPAWLDKYAYLTDAAGF